MRRMLALFALVSLAACAPTLSDVTSIDTSYTLCVNGCRAFSISLDQSGAYTIDSDSVAPLRGRVARSITTEAFKNLPLDDLARCPHPSTITNMDNLTIVVHLKGGRALYCSATASESDDRYSTAERLRTYAKLEAFGVYSAALHERQAAFSDALRNDTLRSVYLERTGCFGNCPAYRVQFQRTGRSRLYVAGSRCVVRTAVVPFERVRTALWEAGAQNLAPNYPRMWVDTPGASLVLDTRRQRIRSDGPDAMSWGPEFSTTVARLDQLVLDTTWNPPLPPRSLHFKPQRC